MPATFITGTTGFIGAELLRRILERDPERRVYALVRAADDRAAERRGREVLFRLFMDDVAVTAAALERVRWVRGDLPRRGLGLAPAARDAVASECDEIVHAAASTQHDLPLDEAAAVNVRGTLGILELAAEGARRGRTPRIVHVSTAYVAGRSEGAIAPEDLPGPHGPFNNTYEETKAAAERVLRERMGDLPITVVRPSIVVGDSGTGRTFSFNVIYFPIKLLYRGQLPYLPGRRSGTLDIVPVDYVCDALLALGRDPAGVGRTYHVTADDDAMTVADFSSRIVEWFNEPRRERGEPLLRAPHLVGPRVWAVLHWLLARRLKGRAKYLLEAFDMYRPYIMTGKRFVASATRRALEGRVAYPSIASYLRRVAEYAVTREWGKDVSWDPSALRGAADLGLAWRCANGHDAGAPLFSCPRCGAPVRSVALGAPAPARH